METRRTLPSGESFMMGGDRFDVLGIKSYLSTRDLVEKTESLKREDGTREKTYSLRKDSGRVSLVYDLSCDIVTVEISQGVPQYIANDLQSIGRQSREKMDPNRHGPVGVA